MLQSHQPPQENLLQTDSGNQSKDGVVSNSDKNPPPPQENLQSHPPPQENQQPQENLWM